MSSAGFIGRVMETVLFRNGKSRLVRVYNSYDGMKRCHATMVVGLDIRL
jgi:hypothetical protein